ncbi:MAG: hypothetical protein MR430_05700 [Lachnospiraceae bacterium]|nr:hypothetical protein [Lachnospiraceae bacterium]
MTIYRVGNIQNHSYSMLTNRIASEDGGGGAGAGPLNSQSKQRILQPADYENSREGIRDAVLRAGRVREREAAWKRDALEKVIFSRLGLSEADLEKAMDSAGGTIRRKGTGAPYSYLADENGIIEYKGVIFTCDNERRRLCLGDVSNPDHVIQIPLSQGGCLLVNRNNIGDLGRAISMFSPEDINRILRALSLDAKLRGTEKEIEEWQLDMLTGKVGERNDR